MEFGNDTVAMERFDITELISNYISSADILIKQKEVNVLWQAPAPLYVWGDEYKVEEVFMNYFSNALNYAEGIEKHFPGVTKHSPGEKQILIDLTQKEGVVRISVFNTGQAIPEEAIPHLWEKFYKVDKARVRAYGGSGIGLSIVKAIMESMNQKYGVNNYENGVEFWFELETN